MDDVTPEIAQITIDTTHARASAEFWRALLGLVYREGHEPRADGEDDPAGHDWLNLYSPLNRRTLAFQQVDELPRSTGPDDTIPQQMHLDLTEVEVHLLRNRVVRPCRARKLVDLLEGKGATVERRVEVQPVVTGGIVFAVGARLVTFAVDQP